MAGYAKLWTVIFNDEWFVGLSCAQRGFFIQLIVLAKTWGDTGVITVKSRHALSQNVGLDGKTCGKFLGDFLSSGKLKAYEEKAKFLTIEIVNYEYWQGLRLEKGGKIPIEKTPTGRENSSLTKPNQSIPNQTKEKSPAAVAAREFWMARYLEETGFEFKGINVDFIAIAWLSKNVTFEEFQQLTNWILTTPEKWFSEHRTPRELRRSLNEIRLKVHGTKPVQAAQDKYSEIGSKA